MRNGGRIPWSATAICETCKISSLMEGPPYERLFGQPFKRPMIPFGAKVEYQPISAKDLSRLHQFFIGYVLYEGESEEDTFWSQTLRTWRRWTHLKSMLGDSMQRKC